jgi:threonine dehydrogenase-like Zn-dependent dehydrogenase
MFETWVQMTELLKSGKLNLDPLFGEPLPLSRYAEGFTMLEGGLAGKVIFTPNGVLR